jgi:heme exporter protein C
MRYFSPRFFMQYAKQLILSCLGLGGLLLCVGLFLTFNAPEDYQQGKTVMIMFIHVPTAWGSMLLYMLMAIAALGTLIYRHPMADVVNESAGLLGAALSFICLVTGSLWGRPMWGTYWVWDARLTSMLILFLIYLGLVVLWSSSEEKLKTGRMAAILTLFGAINLPIIKFSVEWWNTLHQPASVLRLGGPRIHESLLYPLMTMAFALFFLFLALLFMRIENALLTRRLEAAALKKAYQEGQ